ncbi:hypothetical protein UlMin_023498 [Ulmus minor]
MEANLEHHDHDDEEEFFLLDLSVVFGQLEIQPNASYVLYGLDTLNPILTIADNLKLVEEYEETIGTCLVFTKESDSGCTTLSLCLPLENDEGDSSPCVVDFGELHECVFPSTHVIACTSVKIPGIFYFMLS